MVGHVAVDAFSFEMLQGLLVMISAVGQHLGLLQDFFSPFEVLRDLLQHRLQQTVLLTAAEGFGGDHHLVLAIDGGDAVVALNHAVTGLHLGAVVVGDVALDHVAAAAGLLFVVRQEFLDLVAGGQQRLDLLLLALPDRFVSRPFFVLITVLLEHVAHRAIDLAGLLLQIGPGAAPLLRSVRGHLAAIDGEHFFADQPQLIADQQHLAKKRGDFLMAAGDEIGDGGEVRTAVGGNGHEDDILTAQRFDLAAAGETPGVG